MKRTWISKNLTQIFCGHLWETSHADIKDNLNNLGPLQLCWLAKQELNIVPSCFLSATKKKNPNCQGNSDFFSLSPCQSPWKTVALHTCGLGNPLVDAGADAEEDDAHGADGQGGVDGSAVAEVKLQAFSV